MNIDRGTAVQKAGEGLSKIKEKKGGIQLEGLLHPPNIRFTRLPIVRAGTINSDSNIRGFAALY